jgi:hypothetical protein
LQISTEAERRKTSDMRKLKDSYELRLTQITKSAKCEINRLVSIRMKSIITCKKRAPWFEFGLLKHLQHTIFGLCNVLKPTSLMTINPFDWIRKQVIIFYVNTLTYEFEERLLIFFLHIVITIIIRWNLDVKSLKKQQFYLVLYM